MAWIHGINSANFFVFAFLVSFFVTHFDKCQTSYWCLMLGWSLFILAVTVVCLSVVRHRMGTSLSRRKFNVLLHPSYSIAFDDVTSVTCTTLKSITFLVLSSSMVYVPYFADWPGQSHRPSPQMSTWLTWLTCWTISA